MKRTSSIIISAEARATLNIIAEEQSIKMKKRRTVDNLIMEMLQEKYPDHLRHVMNLSTEDDRATRAG